jgi:hypothetical protein
MSYVMWGRAFFAGRRSYVQVKAYFVVNLPMDNQVLAVRKWSNPI